MLWESYRKHRHIASLMATLSTQLVTWPVYVSLLGLPSFAQVKGNNQLMERERERATTAAHPPHSFSCTASGLYS